jgi:hypothetical protein
MKRIQIENVIDLWRECKENALMWDVNNVKNSLDVNVAKKSFIKKLKKLKFHVIGDGTFKLVLSKKSINFVVKVYHNGSIDDKINEDCKFKEYFIEPTYSDGAISIQAKAKRNATTKAYKFFEKMFGKSYCEVFDIHPENVGWLNGKPVIFDFLSAWFECNDNYA